MLEQIQGSLDMKKQPVTKKQQDNKPATGDWETDYISLFDV